MFHIETEEC